MGGSLLTSDRKRELEALLGKLDGIIAGLDDVRAHIAELLRGLEREGR